MTLYELSAHRTDCYDGSSDIRARLSTLDGMVRVRQWLDGYFVLFPTGRVVVSLITRTRKRGERCQKLFSVSASEYITAAAKQKGRK